jgi:hypothetical protein
MTEAERLAHFEKIYDQRLILISARQQIPIEQAGRRVTCFHEAGHAIAFLRLGFEIDVVEVDEDDTGRIFDEEADNLSPTRVHDLVVALIAGSSAQARFMKMRLGQIFSPYCAWHDFEDANKALCDVYSGHPIAIAHRLRTASIRAGLLVRKEWVSISAVAEALFIREKLSQADIEALL